MIDRLARYSGAAFLPRNRSCSYTPTVRFTCPRCGKKYASADEPAPGRVYSLTCRCGTKITVKGPEPRSGAPATAQVTGRAGDAFPAERRRVQGGAPVSSVDAGSLPGRAGPGGWTSRTQTTQIPLKEATPTPPSLAPQAPAAPQPAPPQAAPLDPFADMPDLQAAARGEARPLTSIPEIRGQPPQPQPAPQGYDPFAAEQGLLLDGREALELGSEPSAFEPRIDAGAPGDALEVAFPEQKPATTSRRSARAVLPRVASPGRGRMALAVGVVALVGGGAASAWFFLGETRSTPPAEAVTHATPQPATPAPAQPPTPPPAAAPPAVAAAPPTTASPARPHPAAARPTTPPAATPTAATPTAAAPDAAAPGAAAPSAGPPARPAPAAPPARRELTPAEVSAAIRGSAKAFSACVAEAADKEPALMGRRVGFLITVNPSGAVTEPRLDDPETDASALGACLKDTARRMVFPAYGGEPFQVRIPMTLGARR